MAKGNPAPVDFTGEPATVQDAGTDLGMISRNLLQLDDAYKKAKSPEQKQVLAEEQQKLFAQYRAAGGDMSVFNPGAGSGAGTATPAVATVTPTNASTTPTDTTAPPYSAALEYSNTGRGDFTGDMFAGPGAGGGGIDVAGAIASLNASSAASQGAVNAINAASPTIQAATEVQGDLVVSAAASQAEADLDKVKQTNIRTASTNSILSAMGFSPMDNASMLSKRALDMQDTLQQLRADKYTIQQKDQMSFFDNPIEYIKHHFNRQAEVGVYNNNVERYNDMERDFKTAANIATDLSTVNKATIADQSLKGAEAAGDAKIQTAMAEQARLKGWGAKETIEAQAKIADILRGKAQTELQAAELPMKAQELELRNKALYLQYQQQIMENKKLSMTIEQQAALDAFVTRGVTQLGLDPTKVNWKTLSALPKELQQAVGEASIGAAIGPTTLKAVNNLNYGNTAKMGSNVGPMGDKLTKYTTETLDAVSKAYNLSQGAAMGDSFGKLATAKQEEMISKALDQKLLSLRENPTQDPERNPYGAPHPAALTADNNPFSRTPFGQIMKETYSKTEAAANITPAAVATLAQESAAKGLITETQALKGFIDYVQTIVKVNNESKNYAMFRMQKQDSFKVQADIGESRYFGLVPKTTSTADLLKPAQAGNYYARIKLLNASKQLQEQGIGYQPSTGGFAPTP